MAVAYRDAQLKPILQRIRYSLRSRRSIPFHNFGTPSVDTEFDLGALQEVAVDALPHQTFSLLKCCPMCSFPNWPRHWEAEGDERGECGVRLEYGPSYK